MNHTISHIKTLRVAPFFSIRYNLFRRLGTCRYIQLAPILKMSCNESWWKWREYGTNILMLEWCIPLDYQHVFFYIKIPSPHFLWMAYAWGESQRELDQCIDQSGLIFRCQTNASHFIKSLIVVWWPVAFCGIENLHYSSHKTFSALMALCVGNPSVIGEFLSQRVNNTELICFLCCQHGQAIISKQLSCQWLYKMWRGM